LNLSDFKDIIFSTYGNLPVEKLKHKFAAINNNVMYRTIKKPTILCIII